MTKKILPDNAAEAMKRMIDITRAMKNIVQDETDALASGDGDALTTAIDQKADLAFMYEDASREFIARKEEFRGMQPQLDDLAREQKALQSMETVNRAYYDKAQKNNAS